MSQFLIDLNITSVNDLGKLIDMELWATVAAQVGVPVLPDILTAMISLNITQLQDFEKLVDVKFWLNTINSTGMFPIPDEVLQVFENLNISTISDLGQLYNITFLSEVAMSLNLPFIPPLLEVFG